jgi:nucleoid-associated protein YgaU
VDTLKRLTDQVGPRTDRTDRAPSFDVARIEPDGEAVIGGHAAPGATVELLRGGVTHARTVAGPSGDFVLVPKPLPPGSYDLTLRATQKDGTVSTSKDSVAVELRSGAAEKPVVALTEPDKPAVVLSKPSSDAAAELAVDAVEGETGGRMYVSGHATPGAKVNLYLNDAYIASATASAEGRIAFSIRSGVRPGDYRVRLDQVDASGHVQKRTEVPFKAPAMLAAAAPANPPTPGSGATTDTKTASAGSHAAAAPPPAAGPPSVAVPSPTAAGATHPAPSASAPRVASTAPVTNRKPAAPPPPPAPRENASAAAGQSAPTSTPAIPKPTVSQQTESGAVMPAPAATPAATPDKGTDVVVVPHVDTTVVVHGDSLWRISQSTYGEGVRYSVIYKANRAQIRNPDLIYPGQIFVLPKEQP